MEVLESGTPPKLVVSLPTGKVELLPCDRNRLKDLRQNLLELQSIWVANRFGTGETIADDRGWQLMKAIVALLPRKENPATTGFDLDLLGNDYAQLECLFFADTCVLSAAELHGWQVLGFDMNKFVGCRITLLHGLNPKVLIEEADDLRRSRQGEPQTADTSPDLVAAVVAEIAGMTVEV